MGLLRVWGMKKYLDIYCVKNIWSQWLKNYDAKNSLFKFGYNVWNFTWSVWFGTASVKCFDIWDEFVVDSPFLCCDCFHYPPSLAHHSDKRWIINKIGQCNMHYRGSGNFINKYSQLSFGHITNLAQLSIVCWGSNICNNCHGYGLLKSIQQTTKC